MASSEPSPLGALDGDDSITTLRQLVLDSQQRLTGIEQALAGFQGSMNTLVTAVAALNSQSQGTTNVPSSPGDDSIKELSAIGFAPDLPRGKRPFKPYSSQDHGSMK